MTRVAALGCCLALAAGVALLAPPARADEAERTADLIVRVLAYDGAAASRAGEHVEIGVLYNPGDAASVAFQEGLVAALGKLAATQKVAGRPIGAVPLALAPGTNPTAAVGATRLAALYVGPGLEAAAAAVAELSRGRSILTFTGGAPQPGIAVALLESGGKTRMVIDAAAASAEGARLAPALLRLAETAADGEEGGGEATDDPDQPIRLKSTMTPPKPVAATMVSPTYPLALRAAHVAGRVVLLLEVKRDGTVGKIQARSGHPALAEAATAAVKGWRFEPALQEGKPVAVWLPYPFDFKLD